ncbi:MAG: class I SAM-dependent methyltransferase [Alphaproteobacteria bacterium]|nr:class I SAM-dependent methyltransferase [Alphaproteobacteria bacterium]
MSSTLTRKALSAKLGGRIGAFGLLDRLKVRYRPFVVPLHEVLARIPTGARLFDIGCGNGTLLYLALEYRRCRAAHGYDISADAVSNAGSLIGADDRVRVRLTAPDDALPDLDDYDVVTLIDVLHHVAAARQEAFLRDLASALRPGARLIVMDIDADRRMGSALNQIHDLVLSREWVQPRRAADIAAILADCGLNVSPPSHHRSLWYPHYLLTAHRP